MSYAARRCPQGGASRTRTLFVTVSAFKPGGDGNTLFVNVSPSRYGMRSGEIAGSNASSIAYASPPCEKCNFATSFVVPAHSFYSVTTDGGAIALALWTEHAIGDKQGP